MTAPDSDRSAVDVPLFLNGEGMRGGRVHPHIAHHRFLGETRTAARYRFYVYEGRFPALWPVVEGGVSVPGELVGLSLTAVREEFMPVEPPDGSAALAVLLRPDVHARGTGLVDISDYGGWRAYLERR